MDIPIVRTSQQMNEEKVKQQNELERQRSEERKQRVEALERQRAHIASEIKEAFERNEKSVIYNNDLYPEITKELEEKGYQCVHRRSNRMYMCYPPRPVPGKTTIYFE